MGDGTDDYGFLLDIEILQSKLGIGSSIKNIHDEIAISTSMESQNLAKQICTLFCGVLIMPTRWKYYPQTTIYDFEKNIDGYMCVSKDTASQLPESLIVQENDPPFLKRWGNYLKSLTRERVF